MKTDGAIIMFGHGMFTAQMMMSNPKMWRYNLVWHKGNYVTGFLNANRMPMRNHEDILVFYRKLPTYNPQMEWDEKGYVDKPSRSNNCYGDYKTLAHDRGVINWKYPKSVLSFPKDRPLVHPTQKPVALLEYLIKTYSNEGDTILDCCMGSGSTGVAAVKCGRNFVGIERDDRFFEIAEKRIYSTQSSLNI